MLIRTSFSHRHLHLAQVQVLHRFTQIFPSFLKPLCPFVSFVVNS